MHSSNVLHRDIKSENILSSSQGDIKISDLGLSKFLSQEVSQAKTITGTVPFYSPEIAQNIQYSKEVDVWAFGCFAYEMATGFAPFSNERDEAKQLKDIISKKHEPIPSHWSSSFTDLIDKCLIKEASERWSMAQLLKHPFFSELQDNRKVDHYMKTWWREYNEYLTNK